MTHSVAADERLIIHGTVDEAFLPLRGAFEENFRSRGDTGAACVVYVDGALVVNLWAGQNLDRPWTPDTRTCVFSVSKGVTAVLLHMAHEQGLVDLDAPVAQSWPEFAAAGKQDLTGREVLAHRAGLMGPEVDLRLEDLSAWHPVVDALAKQRSSWEPGTAFGYHALTYGWLAGELLRRATGLRPAEWLEQHVVPGLSLAMTYGADPSNAGFAPKLAPLPPTDVSLAEQYAVMLADPRIQRSLTLGGAIDASDLFGSFNQADILSCELPAANVVSSAHDLARLYAATVSEVDSVRLLQPETVEEARLVLSEGEPVVGPPGARFGSGFQLSCPLRQMAGEGSFGHDGAAGELAFAHPEHRLSFAYVTSQPGGLPDTRAEELCAALRECL